MKKLLLGLILLFVSFQILSQQCIPAGQPCTIDDDGCCSYRCHDDNEGRICE